MSNANCALNSDGTLKDASEIDWFHDPDDDMPVVMGQRCSGRATKPSARVREANEMLSVSVGPVKQKRGLGSLSDNENYGDDDGLQKSMYSKASPLLSNDPLSQGKRLCRRDETAPIAHSPTTPTSTQDATDHVTAQDTTRNTGPLSTPSINRTSSNEWLDDVEVQDIGAATFKACRNDRTLDLDAFFGQPYAAKSKDGKTRRVRDCNQCAKKGYPSQIVSDASTCRRHIAFRHAVSR